ncbi:hypothetical protein GF312_06235 [Candidatus Poribacteria bacterium]|nr:hypothetical protein [Candidatus Poribacteria bacterium]
MLEPTLLTWMLSIAGIILYLPAVYIQVLAIAKPHDQRTKNLLVGKNEDYHDKTYFHSARELRGLIFRGIW